MDIVLPPGTRRNVSLAPYTTFKIGGPAKYFYIARSTKDIVNAVALARKLKLLFFVLAGGSNVLVSDKGFDGLVIKVQNTTYTISKTNVHADAGVSISPMVQKTG